MAADFNLTNQYISASFQNLMQKSGSIPVDGTGSAITNLTVTSSFATTASFALNSPNQVSASYADRAGVADAVSGSNVVGNVATASFALTASTVIGTVTSASYAISASHAELSDRVVQPIITSNGGFAFVVNNSGNNVATVDTNVATINPNTGRITANSFSASNGGFTGSLSGNASTATSASHALVSNTSISASHALQANNATTATTAQTASYVAAANIVGTVATATSASHALRADISDNVASTARLNVTDITASNATFTSASIGYLKTVTGSATIIGDEYIILNADSPTKRFAGIKVYDSGSGLTGSFEWDSIDDNWIQVETGGTSAGMLTGISGSKGSEVYPSNNTIIKGTGNHTVQDSIITDNGTQVTVAGNLSASAFIGDGSGLTNISAPTATSASYAVSASHAEQADNATSASFATTASFALNGGTWNGQFTGDASITGSLIVSRSSGQALTSDGNFTANLFTPSAFSEHQILTAPAFTKTAGVTNTFNINQMVYQDYAFGAGFYENAWMVSQWDSSGFNYGMDLLMGGTRINAALNASGSGTAAQRSAAFSVLDDTPNHSSDTAGDAVARYYGRTMELGLYNSETIVLGNNIQSNPGYQTANAHITARDQVIIGSAEGTAYPYKGFSRAWNGTGAATKDINFYYTGSANFHQTGSLVGPAIVVSGSVVSTVESLTIASTTASMDCRKSDMFTLTLVSGSNTHLNATNVQPGQTISLKVLQPSTATDSYGTMTFESEFAFAGGTAPTITAASGSTDILTFQSYDATTLFGTAVQNLS